MDENKVEVIETTETNVVEDEKEKFGAKDCGVVIGIGIAAIAAYEGTKRGVKWLKNTAIPAIKKKFKPSKPEAVSPDQEAASEPAEEKAEAVVTEVKKKK